MNITLPTCSKILYDANVIIYHIISCELPFSDGKRPVKIIPFTDLAHTITKDLRDLGKKIVTPERIIDEIYLKGLSSIVDDFCDDPRDTAKIKQQLELEEIPQAIRSVIIGKAEQKLIKFLYNKRFEQLDYCPNEEQFKDVKKFYKSLEMDPRMIEIMTRKKPRNEPCPSNEDMCLLCCSVDEQAPFVTNDSDFTWFKKELEDEKLCFLLINLSKYR